MELIYFKHSAANGVTQQQRFSVANATEINEEVIAKVICNIKHGKTVSELDVEDNMLLYVEVSEWTELEDGVWTWLDQDQEEDEDHFMFKLDDLTVTQL